MCKRRNQSRPEYLSVVEEVMEGKGLVDLYQL